ncbi:MAG TPA: hypothetical protein VFP52_04670, partial [Myxococcales bacterium]|nr:hypothetical protein [Myxococcales bacterium]
MRRPLLPGKLTGRHSAPLFAHCGAAAASNLNVAARGGRGIDFAMPPAWSKGARPSEPPQPETGGSVPPLLEGIVRVKVPAEKIQPFLARTALFSGAAPEVVARVAAAVVGLECAEGSEIV